MLNYTYSASALHEVRENREIRVFVSSTFRDMKAERDHLVAKVFPRLRKYCEQRSVSFVEIDLRWGIHDESKVLSVCFQEIEKSRPFFIGLLGKRYGWVPDRFPEDILRKEAWLAESQGRSITELEMMHGVLNNPEQTKYAFFYFQQEDAELPGSEFADTEYQGKLLALKQKIRTCDAASTDEYSSVEELGEMVYNNMLAAIDELFPERKVMTRHERELQDQRSYVYSKSKKYVKRGDHFQTLDSYAVPGRPPLIITGESGAGKSALLASWIQSYMERIDPTDVKVMYHFIGASTHSSSRDAMLDRLLWQLKQEFLIEDEIPKDSAQLKIAFESWLFKAAASGRIVLVIDALNQLEGLEGQQADLSWLPELLPENVSLYVSVAPGLVREKLEERGWDRLKVELLEYKERIRLIDKYLEIYGKNDLNPETMEMIAAVPQSANALFLKVLLEELRVIGVHENLKQQIAEYLQETSLQGLYKKVLKRFNNTYDENRDLVTKTFALLWSARRGLSESELRRLLGDGREELAQTYLSPIMLSAESSLINRNGLIGFSHDYLRAAVEQNYVPVKEEKQLYHRRLASYFAGLSHEDQRKLDEYPWQLAQAEAWGELYELLTNMEFFRLLWKHNPNDSAAFWAKLEDATLPWKNYEGEPLTLVEGFHDLIDNPAAYASKDVFMLAQLLESRYPAHAISLYQYLLLVLKEDSRLSYCYTKLFTLQKDQGKLAEAMETLGALERFSLRGDDQKSYQHVVGLKAQILHQQGEWEQAFELLAVQERICRGRQDPDGLQQCLYAQGELYVGLWQHEAALQKLKEQVDICNEIGSREGYARSIGLQASISMRLQMLRDAENLLREQESIYKELGNKTGLLESLKLQARLHIQQGDLEGAYALLKRMEVICHETNNQYRLLDVHNLKGRIFSLHGNKKVVALKAYEEQEQLAAKLGHELSLNYAWGMIGQTLLGMKEYDSALTYFDKQEKWCTERKYYYGLQFALANKVKALRQQQYFKDAIAMVRRQQEVCLSEGLYIPYAYALRNEAWIHKKGGQLGEAHRLYEEQAAFCKKHRLVFMLEENARNLQEVGELIAKHGEVNRNHTLKDRSGKVDVSQLKPWELELIEVLGRFGYARMTEIWEHASTSRDEDKETWPRGNYFKGMLNLLRKSIVTRKRGNVESIQDAGYVERYDLFKLSEQGRALYEEMFGTKPVQSQIDVAYEQYRDDAALFFVQDTMASLSANQVQVENHSGPDAGLCLSVDGKIIILDSGKMSQDDFFAALDRVYYKQHEMHIISISPEVSYIQTRANFYRWVKARFGSFENATGKIKGFFNYCHSTEGNLLEWEDISF